MVLSKIWNRLCELGFNINANMILFGVMLGVDFDFHLTTWGLSFHANRHRTFGDCDLHLGPFNIRMWGDLEA